MTKDSEERNNGAWKVKEKSRDKSIGPALMKMYRTFHQISTDRMSTFLNINNL